MGGGGGCAAGIQMEEAKDAAKHLQCTGQPAADMYQPSGDSDQAEDF